LLSSAIASLIALDLSFISSKISFNERSSCSSSSFIQEISRLVLGRFKISSIVNLRHLPLGFFSLSQVSFLFERSSTQNSFSNSAKSLSFDGLRLPNDRI